MPRNATCRNLAMLAMVCMVVLYVGCKGYAHMANNSTNNSTTTTTNGNRKLVSASKAPTATALATVGATTPAAQQPAVHAAPLAPSTAPLANWRIAASGPSTAKQATNGVGPAGKVGTVPYVVVHHIAAGGATMATLQAAITALGLRGKHPAMAALHWLAKNRGYSFACTNGVLSLG